MKVESVTKPLLLGEGPHWCEDQQLLYFVDIPGATVHKYDPATNIHIKTDKFEDGMVSLIIPLQYQKEKYAVTVGHDLKIMTWDGESSKPTELKHVLSVEADKIGNRWNDGKADPSGRLWAGTMGKELQEGGFEPEQGALYSISKNHSVTQWESNVGISNGLAWSSNHQLMYYIDSFIPEVSTYDFDAQNGTISNRRPVFDLTADGVKGAPDGMTIDAEGKLWVACFSGAQVIRVDPETGKLLQQVPIPAPNVTSVTFGGPKLDELYVTTASINMSREQQQQFPLAGSVFRVTSLGVKGLPGQSVDL